MTLSEYRKALSWQGAIDLSKGLVLLAEELPGSEEMGLSFQLRNLMVELPSAVASDLLRGTESRHESLYKLLTVLELVDRVYPALDTAGTRTAADRLAERLTGTAFQEELSPAGAEPAPELHHEPVGEPANVPIVDAPAEPAAPAPETAAPAPVAEPEPTHVAVQPASEEQHVQPDSV
jgi:hypothetical protein